MKVLICPSCGYAEETQATYVVAMPRHPPKGRLCPASGTPVQPMLQVHHSNAEAKLLQEYGRLCDKMIVAQRAQADAYKQLDELRGQADEVVEQIRALRRKQQA